MPTRSLDSVSPVRSAVRPEYIQDWLRSVNEAGPPVNPFESAEERASEVVDGLDNEYEVFERSSSDEEEDFHDDFVDGSVSTMSSRDAVRIPRDSNWHSPWQSYQTTIGYPNYPIASPYTLASAPQPGFGNMPIQFQPSVGPTHSQWSAGPSAYALPFPPPASWTSPAASGYVMPQSTGKVNGSPVRGAPTPVAWGATGMAGNQWTTHAPTVSTAPTAPTAPQVAGRKSTEARKQPNTRDLTAPQSTGKQSTRGPVQSQAARSRNSKVVPQTTDKSERTPTTRTTQGVAQSSLRHAESDIDGESTIARIGRTSPRVRIQTPTDPTHSRGQSRSRTQSEATADSVSQVADRLQSRSDGPGGLLSVKSQGKRTSANQKVPKTSDGSQEAQPRTETVAISSRMSAADIAMHLCDHGCKNITERLDISSCSTYPLSSGGFGDVYRGKLNDGTPVAIKTVRLQMNPSEDGQKPLKHAARELHTWSKCRHPNVVELLGLVEFRGQIGMVSLWLENGNLSTYLAQHHDADRCQLSTQISEGLAYLHRCNIVHGDLKGLNVLISNTGAPLLADFGNAILQERTLQFTRTTVKHSASPRWAAPEILEGSGTYSFAADVYALGMTILETITGQIPYAGKGDYAVYFAVGVKKEHPKRPEEKIPPGSQHGNTLWSMLTKCWAFEAEARPHVDNVVGIMKTITREGLIRIPEVRQSVAAGARSEKPTLVQPRKHESSKQPLQEVRPEVPAARATASKTPASAPKTEDIPAAPKVEESAVPSLSPLAWQRVNQRLLNWAMVWPLTELDKALASTERGHQIEEIALSIWCTQLYKRYVRTRMSESDGDASKIDRMCVPPNMADAISTAVYNERYDDACQMLKDMWAPFGLDGMPKLIIVLARHRRDEHHWVTHLFSLPDGQLSTYDTYPERSLPDERLLGWWVAIRSAWLHASHPPEDVPVQKMVRINRPLQLLVDCSIAAAAVCLNLLMDYEAERGYNFEEFRNIIKDEVKWLRQRKELGRLAGSNDNPN